MPAIVYLTREEKNALFEELRSFPSRAAFCRKYHVLRDSVERALSEESGVRETVYDYLRPAIAAGAEK